MHLNKLVELNLSINKVENLDPLSKLKNINKLYLAKNAISKSKSLKSLKLVRYKSSYFQAYPKLLADEIK